MDTVYSPIIEWLINGSVGISARTMAAVALGVTPKNHGYPHDTDDLSRCLALLECAPEVRLAFPKIAAVSKEWKEIIANWKEIEESFIAETGSEGSKFISAPRTNRLLGEIITRALRQ